jgi:hypothetical protein
LRSLSKYVAFGIVTFGASKNSPSWKYAHETHSTSDIASNLGSIKLIDLSIGVFSRKPTRQGHPCPFLLIVDFVGLEYNV